jgi:hypothetical protein
MFIFSVPPHKNNLALMGINSARKGFTVD